MNLILTLLTLTLNAGACEALLTSAIDGFELFFKPLFTTESLATMRPDEVGQRRTRVISAGAEGLVFASVTNVDGAARVEVKKRFHHPTHQRRNLAAHGYWTRLRDAGLVTEFEVVTIETSRGRTITMPVLCGLDLMTLCFAHRSAETAPKAAQLRREYSRRIEALGERLRARGRVAREIPGEAWIPGGLILGQLARLTPNNVLVTTDGRFVIIDAR